MRIVVIGDPVPASPNTGVDTISGEGLAEVMAGADAAAWFAARAQGAAR